MLVDGDFSYSANLIIPDVILHRNSSFAGFSSGVHGPEDEVSVGRQDGVMTWLESRERDE